MWRFLFLAFLVAHGLVHIAVWAPRYNEEKMRFDASHSWLLGDARSLAIALAIASAVILVVAGFALWAQADWWRPATVLGLAVSLTVIVLYFNPWYLFITAVNVGLIAGIVWLSWPTKSMVGA
jgi:hypothetical protein